ncbi:alpha/beta hydrolase [Kitasatospora sp. NBC_01300]|uniref:alpha/beta hydrolase n=1 Tax=Kitasatospora sp. NBC_01300 TaxID=2903574 RepID=UPI002F910709|nr:alpha/beta hydrolase [Kitasatospora sp. NBC_01300]
MTTNTATSMAASTAAETAGTATDATAGRAKKPARRGRLAAAALAVLAAVLPVTTASPAQAAPTGAAGRPTWCPTVPGHQVDCTTMRRPLVADEPHLGGIGVSYAVVRHSRPGPARGTIALNPGGPGETLIDRADQVAGALQGVLDDYDLLLLDPRGTGRSGRLPCDVTEADYRFAPRPAQRQLVADCAGELGPRARGYTSAATADDLDAARARLGAPKLVLYGLSYGTYLMPVYADRHPQRVESMVLSGAYPLAFDSLARPGAQQVSLTLRRICERSGACDPDGAVRDLAATTERLRTRPLVLTASLGGRPRTVVFSEDKLADLMYEPATRGIGLHPEEPGLLGALPAALHALAAGDDAPLTALVRAEVEHTGTEDQASFLAVTCNDYARAWDPAAPPAERRRQYRAALAAANPADFGAFSVKGWTEGQTDGGDNCLSWPRRGTAAPQPTDLKNVPDVPVLVLSGDLDTNTPEANSRLSAAQFRRSAFVSVPNSGHIPEMESTGCAVDISTHFIRTGTVGDTSCLAHIPPVPVVPVPR